VSRSRPSVFVVYAQGVPAIAERVRALADRLRSDGIDVVLDREVEDPPEGQWEWTSRQLYDHDLVLFVWTAAQRAVLENEHIAPHRRTYADQGLSGVLVVSLFEDESRPDVPVSGLDDAAWIQLPKDYEVLRVWAFNGGLIFAAAPGLDDDAASTRDRHQSESWGEQIRAAQHAGDLEVRETMDSPWPRAPDPDVALDDHLWDTGSAAALDVLARRIPATTRGSTIITGGRVRHKQRPIPRCPNCDGPLVPSSVAVRFELAPEPTAIQHVPGHRCACGSQWPDPYAMRSAHAAAFGMTGEPAR
jgi:hypothetical protein